MKQADNRWSGLHIRAAGSQAGPHSELSSCDGHSRRRCFHRTLLRVGPPSRLPVPRHPLICAYQKLACFVHCDRGRFTAPWKWAEMITAPQDLIIGESSVPRHGTDKTGKLLRILSRIAAELIYLAGS